MTINPSFTHSQGKLNKTPKFIPIKAAKNVPAYVEDNSPVVNGLAFVLSTCLSISLSAKSLIIHPALLQLKAPTVNKPTVHNEGSSVGVLSAKPQ